MVEIREREVPVVTTADGSGAGAAAMVIIALLLVAIIGYMIYAFNNGSTNTIERDNTTTIQQPVPMPSTPMPSSTPAPSSAPETPSGGSDSGSSSSQ